MSVGGVLKTLEDDARAEFDHYHVPQLAKQFLAGYVTVLLGSLAAAGWHVAGWAALWSLLGGSALATVERLWPTVPWGSILGLLRNTRAVAAPPEMTPGEPPAPPHG